VPANGFTSASSEHERINQSGGSDKDGERPWKMEPIPSRPTTTAALAETNGTGEHGVGPAPFTAVAYACSWLSTGLAGLTLCRFRFSFLLRVHVSVDYSNALLCFPQSGSYATRKEKAELYSLFFFCKTLYCINADPLINTYSLRPIKSIKNLSKFEYIYLLFSV
jgi:hypothetical protein